MKNNRLLKTEISLSFSNFLQVFGTQFLFYRVVNLWKLLGNILGGEVFTRQNTRLLRAISFLLFFATIIFVVAGYFYMPFYLLAVCAAFMVLIVRVVKNCFAAAVLLKDENDMTI